MQSSLFLIKIPVVRLGLALACGLILGVSFAESCITADEYNHVQNGGSPLPGTTTQSVASAPVTIDGVTYTKSSLGPVDLFTKGLSIFIR